MTSKEALCEILKRTDKQESEYTIKCAEIIVKDLEILDILKSHIVSNTINCEPTSNTIELTINVEGFNPYTYIVPEGRGCPINRDDINENFQKIKGWLEE